MRPPRPPLLGALLGALLAALALCGGPPRVATAEPPSGVAEGVLLEALEEPIRNGYSVPKTIFLSTPQLKSIGWISDGGRQICTGTVFSDDAVITARHCFVSESTRLSGGVLSFSIPQDYDTTIAERTFEFSTANVLVNTALDVAIIKFSTPVFKDIPNLKAIPINTLPIEDDLYANLSDNLVSVAGYGETYVLGERPLAFAAVNVALITSRSIVVNGERRQGICQGDSGGPLIAPGAGGEPHIFAIESKGDPCCIGVDQLTRVDVLTPWIRGITNYTAYRGPEWPAECLGVSNKGSCRGDLLTCDAPGVLKRTVCSIGQICDYSLDLGRFACLNPCPGVPELGTCAGTVLKRCVRGQIEERDCAPLQCGNIVEDSGVFACVDRAASALPEGTPGAVPMCNPKDDELVAQASEARFVGASCATPRGAPRAPLPLALLPLAALAALRARRRRGSLLS